MWMCLLPVRWAMFSPRRTIPNIQAKVVAGAANNQLATELDGARLAQRDILYAPDYVINAGGIINVEHEYFGNSSEERVLAEIGEIPKAPRIDFCRSQRYWRSNKFDR